MFEAAELGRTVDKQTYEREVATLRPALLRAQYRMLEAQRFAVVILINGVHGAGKGETVNTLHEWMDPRHLHSHAFGAPSDEERERPPMWRYWRALPPRGRIGIFFGSWYTEPIVRRARRTDSKHATDQAVTAIEHHERMLTDEGVLLLKYWFHLSKKAQARRLAELKADKRTRWRVTDDDWDYHRQYDRYRQVCEGMLRGTSNGAAPWTVIDSVDARYRNLTVGRAILHALTERLDAPPGHHTRGRARAIPAVPQDSALNVLTRVDLSQSLAKNKYPDALARAQRRLNQLCRDKRFRERGLVVVYEGWDAAGKGGSIRRVTAALDARMYRVIPVAAPSEEERAQPYLWRFWRQLPRRGGVTLFDRSWYGRVLVERVEQLCSEADWGRAYAEINDFEEQMARHGTVVAKLWLHISKDEQLKRFKERQRTKFKQYKITDDDWRNRDRWPQYELAVCDMVDRTSTTAAPWTIVPANDKYLARVAALRAIADAIERSFAR